MSVPVPTVAASALAELLEVSPQVDAAVILERDGGALVASAPDRSARMAERFGTTCVRLLAAAEQARNELGREPVAQVEVATPGGHVFVVADASWIVAAVTDADPTVGLVFYDLKTALRSVREARAGADVGTSTATTATPPLVETSTGDEQPYAEHHHDAAGTSGADVADDRDDATDEAATATTGAPVEPTPAPAPAPVETTSRWRRRKS